MLGRRLGAQATGEGRRSGKHRAQAEPASAPMGNCLGWLSLSPGNQVCAGGSAGWGGAG